MDKHRSHFSPRGDYQRAPGPSSESFKKRPSSAMDQHNKRLKSSNCEEEQKRDELQKHTDSSGLASLKVLPMGEAPVTVPCTIETRVTMSLHGQTIVCDLKELEPEPQGLIELLKVTKSERGVWMTVGAYYRRAGKPLTAISVMTELLKVMSSNKIHDENQKSVFLLLAGCEADLARDAKLHGRDNTFTSKHEQNAQHWLRKVYGSKAPANDTTGDRLSALVSISKGDSSTKQSAISGPKQTSQNKSNGSKGKYISHVRVLEREVQCLRDTLSAQGKRNTDLCADKRKLEEDLHYERGLRCQLQNDLDDMRKEYELARRMEWCALDQLKREVATRRKAEECAKQERAKRQEAFSQMFGKRSDSDAASLARGSDSGIGRQ